MPTVPTWALGATADTWPGEFNGGTALARLSERQRASIPAVAQAAKALLAPIDRDLLVKRLTALGIVMAPNRSPADAQMWVRETARLLGDLPEDLLLTAIDECQKRLKFLPTVAEIRELADPFVEQRRRDFARLDAMRRYLESGQPLPQVVPPKRSLMDRRGETMTESECDELNGILERLGACSRYRSDGSRYEVSKSEPKKVRPDRPQMPTRADYIEWGVDPAVLDQIVAVDGKMRAAGGN